MLTSNRNYFGVVAFAIILCFCTALAFGLPQVSASSQSIAGSVRDASGAPVSGARVSLGQSGTSTPRETVTDAQGKFSLVYSTAGNYVLHADKDGYQDATQPLILPARSEMPLAISLIRVNSAPGAPDAEGTMQFSDKPEFTVAGITDWTAAGGHGSDVNLRATEGLAQETRDLSSKNPQPRVSDPELERRLRATVQQDPSSFQANHALGTFCLRERHFADAIPLLEKANGLNPTDYEAAYHLAQAYEGASQHEKAKALVEKILAANDRADLHRLLADVHEQLNDSLAAEREYERASQLDPSEQNYFAWGGELLVHRAVEAAVAVFNKGVRAFPQSERMLVGLGAALYANGAYDAAATQLCDAVDLNPSDRRSYLFLGKMEQAAPRGLPCAEEKLALFAHRNPDDAQANFYYAIALQQSGKEQDKKHVASLLQNAVKLDPEFAEGYLQLGIVQSQIGDWVGARASYEKAALIRPSLPDPHFRLAQIYKHTGDDLRASQELQTFERLKQSDAVAVEERRREIRQFVIVPNASSDSSPH